VKSLWLTLFLSAFAWANEGSTLLYAPRNGDQWIKAMEARKDPAQFLSFCRRLAPKDAKSMDAAENQMICVLALIEAGFPLAAEALGSELVKQQPGSSMSIYALNELEKSFHHSNFDAEKWQSLSQNISLPEKTLPVSSMFNYLRGLRLSPLNYQRWTNEAFAQVDPQTYWGERIQFYDALVEFQEGQLKDAIADLEELLQQPDLPDAFRQTVSLQLARLYFESTDYSKAEKLYQKYANSSRDYGRALLERAWIYYKRKEYDLALGQIVVLKSSFFAGLRDPERHLLTALIYRDLCHFDQIKLVQKDFEKDYKSVLTAVKTHQDFARNQILLGLTLANGHLQSQADRVAQLRLEHSKWKALSGRGDLLDRRLTDFYTQEEKTLRAKIEFNNRDLLRAEAEKVLKTGNQLKLLDYISDLEKLRPKNSFTHETFQAVREGANSYEKLYWPHANEFWWGELNNYRVLIDDKCAPGRAPAGADK
jgi:outer membrane protein assembly factor BamD (BamD/ComL family)